jgi:hypothetical protein
MRTLTKPMCPRLSRPTLHGSTLRESAIFRFHSFILLHRQPFFNIELFCYSELIHSTIMINHFLILSSSCYSEVNHFTTTRSAIFVTVNNYFMILTAILIQWRHYCCFISHFAGKGFSHPAPLLQLPIFHPSRNGSHLDSFEMSRKMTWCLCLNSVSL